MNSDTDSDSADSAADSDFSAAAKNPWKTRAVSFAWAAGFLLFFVVVAVVIVSGKPPPQKAEVREPVFSVLAATARIAPARPSVLLSGEAEARDYAVLTAPVEAEVLSVFFREGETFPARRRLVMLDLREEELQAESRRASAEVVRLQIAALEKNRAADEARLAETRNLLELARRDYARNITLQAKNLVTRARIEDAEQTVGQQRRDLIALQNQVDNYPLEKKRLEQELAAAEVALKQAELLIERGEMRAPFAGRVAKVSASTGTRTTRGMPLLEIFNPASVRLRALVPNRYAGLLAADGGAQAVLEYDGEARALPLSNVAPQSESGRGGVEAFFDLPEGDWVLGATFEFQLQLPAAPALELPFDAVYAESRVYVIDSDNRARGAECARLGVSRGAEGIRALLRCPEVAEGARIVATQLPGIAEGAKVRVLAAAP